MKRGQLEGPIKLFSTLAIPIIIAFFGWQIDKSISSNNLEKDYVDLAISILTSEKKIEPSIRSWAIEILQDNSPVKLTPEGIAELEAGAILYTKKSADESFQSAQYDQSLIHFQELIKQQPENAEYHSKAGFAHFKLGNFKDALKCYDKAISLNSTNAQFYYLRSLVYWKLDDLTNSNKDLSESIKYNPKQHAAYNNLGMNLIRLGDTLGACEKFSMALELGNTNAITNHSRFCKEK